MKPVTVYGIKNCETMKKAFAWLDGRKIAYTFHDYKKAGADEAVLKRAVKELGWETAINRKGTSWRALPEKRRAAMTEKDAIAAALENPSLIKRPLVVHAKGLIAGFDADEYKKIFG
jgi:Spx/MgsR family transcriptional regulator